VEKTRITAPGGASVDWGLRWGTVCASRRLVDQKLARARPRGPGAYSRPQPLADITLPYDATRRRWRRSGWASPSTPILARIYGARVPMDEGMGPSFIGHQWRGCLAKKSRDSRRGRWSSVKARTRGWPQQPCPTIQWQGTNLSARPATRLWGPHGGGSNDARESEQWGPYASESEGLGERGPPVIHETWWGKAGLRSVRAHNPEADRASGGMGQNCGIRPTLGLHFFPFSLFSFLFQISISNLNYLKLKFKSLFWILDSQYQIWSIMNINTNIIPIIIYSTTHYIILISDHYNFFLHFLFYIFI
jgi:hypothetical protein